MEKRLSRRGFIKKSAVALGAAAVWDLTGIIGSGRGGAFKASASEGRKVYKDFHAGDEMHRLGINLTGIEEIEAMSGSALIEKNEPNASETKTAVQISIKANGKTTVFELNNSPAARDLVAQLPLSVPVENYSNNEKIFYPPKKLNTTDTPQADARAGTLAYYAPWGDVVMFYGRFGSAAGLYELGHATSGSEHIQEMSGTMRVEKSIVP